jgi:hypothetical protein
MPNQALPPHRLAYLRRRVRRAQDIIPDSLDSLKSLYSTGMNLIWSQEDDIGPKEIFDELGTEGAALFVDGAAFAGFILSKDPDWKYPVPTHEYTINDDGSVTIGAPIPEIPTPD